MPAYTIEPKEVPKIDTKYRTIQTKIPVPESIPLLKRLRKVEARSLHWQAPIFWDRAQGVNVFDKYGNKWLDMSSGIVVTSVGHGRQEVIDAVKKQADHGLLYNFTFPSEIRMQLLEKLVEITPPYLEKGFLMSAGSEATENALKLARKYAHITHGLEKNVIVSFQYAFHGRTLGSQMMGGLPKLKDWIKNHDPDMIQVPHPNGFYNEDVSFDLFEQTLEDKGIEPERVAAVMLESYQGSTVFPVPKQYAQKLRDWTTKNGALMLYDEVQVGFGRTGKFLGYQHYDVKPDVVCLGKAISGSLPISATLARKEIMDVFSPGEMTSTHTGNPLSCAAALANIEILLKEELIDRCVKMGNVLEKQLAEVVERHPICGFLSAKGLFAGIQITNPGTKTPRKDLAYKINQKLYEKGVMVFVPVGPATVKMAPPFIIPEDAIMEAVSVLDESISEVEKEEKLH